MITVNRRNTVIGVFNDRRNAQLALNDLQARGYNTAQLGLTGPNTAPVQHGPLDRVENETEEAAAYGAFAGACLGALWVVGAAWSVFPAWLPSFASPLAVLIAMVAGGAVVGGVIGALIGLATGDSDTRVRTGTRSDRTVVSVKTPDGLRYEEACCIINDHGGCGTLNRRSTDRSIAM